MKIVYLIICIVFIYIILLGCNDNINTINKNDTIFVYKTDTLFINSIDTFIINNYDTIRFDTCCYLCIDYYKYQALYFIDSITYARNVQIDEYAKNTIKLRELLLMQIDSLKKDLIKIHIYNNILVKKDSNRLVKSIGFDTNGHPLIIY